MGSKTKQSILDLLEPFDYEAKKKILREVTESVNTSNSPRAVVEKFCEKHFKQYGFKVKFIIFPHKFISDISYESSIRIITAFGEDTLIFNLCEETIKSKLCTSVDKLSTAWK
jgi:hypothetical protein